MVGAMIAVGNRAAAVNCRLSPCGVDNSTVMALVFFLAGLPVAFFLEKAILALSTPTPEGAAAADSDHRERAERPALPWQTGVWPSRVRIGIAVLLPFLMAAA